MPIRPPQFLARMNRWRIKQEIKSRSKQKARAFFHGHGVGDKTFVQLRADRIQLKVRDRTILKIKNSLNYSNGFSNSKKRVLQRRLKTITNPSFSHFIESPFLYEEVCRAAATYAFFDTGAIRISGMPAYHEESFFSLRRQFSGKEAREALSNGYDSMRRYLATVRALTPKSATFIKRYMRAIHLLMDHIHDVGMIRDPLA